MTLLLQYQLVSSGDLFFTPLGPPFWIILFARSSMAHLVDVAADFSKKMHLLWDLEAGEVRAGKGECFLGHLALCYTASIWDCDVTCTSLKYTTVRVFYSSLRHLVVQRKGTFLIYKGIALHVCRFLIAFVIITLVAA
jgi:hypothetical protein